MSPIFPIPSRTTLFRLAAILPFSLAILLNSGCAGTGVTEQGAGGSTTATTTTPDTAPTTDASTAVSAESRAAVDMLTPAEVAGIIGRTVQVKAATDTTATATTTTSFVASGTATATSGAAPLVNVTLAADGMLADARDMARTSGHKTTDVPSLGRMAFYDDTQGSLYVNDKGHTLIINVPGQIQGKTRQQVATQLGRIASGRL